MPDRYAVRVLPVAEEDLEEIVSYIALDDVEAALELADRIEEGLTKLTSYPKLGRIPRDQDLREGGYRYLIIGDYLAFYTIEKRSIVVHRILHGRRDYKELL